MKICLVNMDIEFMDKVKNLAVMESHIQRAKKIDEGIDIFVFPELSCVNYILEEGLEKYTEDMDGFCVAKSRELAKKYNVNLIAGFLEKSENGKPFNTSFAVNKKGELVGKYRKNHLFPQSEEVDMYSAGDSLCLFDFDGWKCGLAICFDIRFPRLFETYAVNGAEIVFVPFNWVQGKNKFEMLKVYTQARAAENQIYCAGVDRIGEDKYFKYTGSWMLSDPIGNDVSKTYEDVYHIGEVKKEEIEKIRKALPLRPSFKENYTVKKN